MNRYFKAEFDDGLICLYKKVQGKKFLYRTEDDDNSKWKEILTGWTVYELQYDEAKRKNCGVKFVKEISEAELFIEML